MNATSISFGDPGGALVVMPTTAWMAAPMILRPVPAAQPAPTPTPPLSDAIAQLLASKTRSGRRARTVTNLRQSLTMFARGREARPIAEVTLADVEAFIEGGPSQWARSTRMFQLSGLFSFAIRRGWVQANLCDRIERVAIETKPPPILTPTQARSLMEYVSRAEPRMLAWTALALFAGLRPSEVDRIEWPAIRIDTDPPCAVVDGAASKTRRRRIVHLEPAAVAWLRFARDRGALLGERLVYVTRRRCLRRMRDALGFESWPQDVLRHTTATYWLGIRNDTGYVARQLGNSVPILQRHYVELATQADAEAFWSLRPT